MTMMCLSAGSDAPPRAGLLVLDDELALAADGAGEGDDAVDAGDLGGVLRTAGLEELGDAGQTAGDVLGLGDLARGLGEQGAGGDLVALVDRDLRAGGDGVVASALAFASMMSICGLRSSLCSMTTVPMRPEASSSSRLTVTPGIMSWNDTCRLFP